MNVSKTRSLDTNVNKSGFVYYVCCFNATKTARFIAILGVALSFLVMIILLDDIHKQEYNKSRSLTVALGLDWSINNSSSADSGDNVISGIIITYSLLQLCTCMALLYATLTYRRQYTIPWFIYEVLGCISKLLSIWFYLVDDNQSLKFTFVLASTVYIGFVVWCWVVVYIAQSSWTIEKRVIFHYELSRPSLVSMNSKLDDDEDTDVEVRDQTCSLDISPIESPPPFHFNETYTKI